MHLGVVVEVTIDVALGGRRWRHARDQASVARLTARRPGAYAAGPGIERAIAIAARVELLVTVKPQVDELGGHVFDERPAPRRLGDDERDAMRTQEGDEALA